MPKEKPEVAEVEIGPLDEMHEGFRRAQTDFTSLAGSHGFLVKGSPDDPKPENRDPKYAADVVGIKNQLSSPELFEGLAVEFKNKPEEARTVTSGLDSHETWRSLHNVGAAIDIRGHHFDRKEGEAAAARLQTAAGPPFYIQFETRNKQGEDLPRHVWHFHIEYDNDEMQDELDDWWMDSQRRVVSETPELLERVAELLARGR